MKRLSFSLLAIIILSFVIVQSCSTEEEETVAPVVQTPQPEPEPEEETQSETDNQTQDDTSNETLEVDTDGDGVVDSEDAFPLNPVLTEDLWGQIVDLEPELFFANDVSQNAQEQFRRDLNLAITEWGNFGPLEYWIFGNDISAALELAEIYCERRTSRGELFYYNDLLEENNLTDVMSICLTEMMHPHADLDWNNNNISTYFTEDLNNYTGRLEYFRETSDNLPSGNAVLSGHRQWGFHHLLNSLPFQYDENEFNIPKEDMTIIVLHEYFHVINSANVFSKIFIQDEIGNTVRPENGPAVMSEGSANYISNYTIRKLINEGKYEKSNEWNLSLRDEMRNKMNELKEMQINCPNFNLSELNYGNICDPYTFGQWGIAYLLNRANNQNALQELMFPLINDLGYYGAFEEAFGITFETFNQEFLEFLELPIEEQLEIIPDI